MDPESRFPMRWLGRDLEVGVGVDRGKGLDCSGAFDSSGVGLGSSGGGLGSNGGGLGSNRGGLGSSGGTGLKWRTSLFTG